MVEMLETRVMPVIGGSVLAPVVSPGTNLDGVVEVGAGSGSELNNQREILTAAHVINPGQQNIVTFNFQRAGAAVNIPIIIPVNPGGVAPANFVFPQGAVAFVPNANGVGQNDIAVINLRDPNLLPGVNVPNLEMVAPFSPFENGYPIIAPAAFPAANTNGQTFNIVGYGLTGTGNFGITGPAGELTLGQNTYDQAVPPAGGAGDLPEFPFGAPNILEYDFDNGAGNRNVFGGAGLRIANANPALNESMAAPGDSGGPGLVGGIAGGNAAQVMQIVGVQSIANPGLSIVPFGYGTIGGQTLADSYNGAGGFIQDAQNTAYGIVLDMRSQVLGRTMNAAGVQDPLTITVGRGTPYPNPVFQANGPNLLIQVTDTATPAFSDDNGYYFDQPVNYPAPAGGQWINSLVLRGNDGGDTFQLIGNLGVGPITILGGAGNDNIVIGQTGGGDLDDLSQNVTVDGGGGTNTLVVNDVAASVGRNYALTASSLQWGGAASIQFSNINNFTLNASNGASNTEAITNTVAGTTTINGGTRGDAMTVLATGGVLQLNGTGGTNSFTIGEDNIGDLNNFAAEINVDGGVGGMANELVINDPFAVGGSAGRNYIDNGASLTWGAPGGQFIGFAHIKDFTLNASNYGNNTEAILNTRPDITTINGGDLNNAFFVGSSSVANATGTLVGVVGTLNIDGGGGANTLTINDQRNTKAQTYTVTGTQVTFLSGRGAIATVAYSNVNQLTLNGGSGGNIVRVQSTSIPTGINSGSGPDTITVAGGPPNPNRLDGIQGQLVINGPGGAIGPPNDAIIINDSGNVPGWNYVEAPNSLSRQGIAPITFFNYSLLVFARCRPPGPLAGRSATQWVIKST